METSSSEILTNRSSEWFHLRTTTCWKHNFLSVKSIEYKDYNLCNKNYSYKDTRW